MGSYHSEITLLSVICGYTWSFNTPTYHSYKSKWTFPSGALEEVQNPGHLISKLHSDMFTIRSLQNKCCHEWKSMIWRMWTKESKLQLSLKFQMGQESEYQMGTRRITNNIHTEFNNKGEPSQFLFQSVFHSCFQHQLLWAYAE